MSGYDNTNAIKMTGSTQQRLFLSALQRTGVYSMSRLVVGVGLSLMLSENPAFSLDVLQVLRECYTVSIAIIAARYVLFNIFSR